jgi:hypothetical protein
MNSTSHLHLASLAIISAAATACIPPAFARLDDILVTDRPAQPEEFGRVKITRAGASQDGAPGLAILKGDTVTTGPDAVAVVTLAAGWEVIFEPGTVASIENPSIFVRWGKLIIKKLQEVKEALTVNNEFVSAGAEGTVFVFEVTRDGEVRIGVVEGRVVVTSKTASWNAVTYRAGDAGMIRARVGPTPVRRLDPQTTRLIQRRVTQVEELRRLRVSPGALVPVAPVIVAPPPAPPPAAPTVVSPGVDVRVALCTVPNIIERTEDAARQALAGANLQVGTVQRLESGRLVTSQTPAAGSRVACGGAVDFTVGTLRD